MAFYPGYSEHRQRVERQSLDEDLATIDELYGRDALRYGDGPREVKAEALKQLEREFTKPNT